MEMDISEMREKRIREAYEELGATKFEDANRGKLMNEIKTLEELRLSESQAETTRLNNNEKNSIEEEKLAVERERLKLDRKKVRSTWGQIAAYFIAGFGSFGASYFLDPWFQKNPNFMKFSERLRDQILKK